MASASPTPNLAVEAASQPKENKTFFSDAIDTLLDDCVDFDPCSSPFLETIEPFIEKARRARASALQTRSRPSVPEELATETLFTFDPQRHGLLEAFKTALGLPPHIALETLHDHFKTDIGRRKQRPEKERLFSNLLQQQPREAFQRVYHDFFCDFVAPTVAAAFSPGSCQVIRFQSFPCIRIVRPGEFSIGPHADAAYGFAGTNVNFYLPLTPIARGNSLFLESKPGREDWHDLRMQYGQVTRFHGSECMHWTPRNRTNQTRVSLDFRVIAGPCWYVDSQDDQYMAKSGYYTECRLAAVGPGQDPRWERCPRSDIPGATLALESPDRRIGFPFTDLKS